MPYIPALDGIRAIAIIAVMVFHAGGPILRGGFLGVDVFFVLSGFLITSLLQNEIARTGRIDIRRFYVRRLMRLGPPLAVALLLYLAIAPHVWPAYAWHLQDALLAATYLSDYSRALWGMPDMLRHTWSLAVEEHFYMLWPLVLLVLRPLSHRTALFVLLALYVAGTAWRIACLEWHGWDMTYPRFDTRLTGMVIGAVTAVLLSKGRIVVTGRAAAALCLALYVLVFLSGWRDPAALILGTTVAELATASVIVLIMQGNSMRVLTGTAMTYIGQLSYGLYLFHYPIMLYLREAHGWLAALTVGSLAAALLAALSYHTVEAWVRRRKMNIPVPAAS